MNPWALVFPCKKNRPFWLILLAAVSLSVSLLFLWLRSRSEARFESYLSQMAVMEWAEVRVRPDGDSSRVLTGMEKDELKDALRDSFPVNVGHVIPLGPGTLVLSTDQGETSLRYCRYRQLPGVLVVRSPGNWMQLRRGVRLAPSASTWLHGGRRLAAPHPRVSDRAGLFSHVSLGAISNNELTATFVMPETRTCNVALVAGTTPVQDGEMDLREVAAATNYALRCEVRSRDGSPLESWVLGSADLLRCSWLCHEQGLNGVILTRGRTNLLARCEAGAAYTMHLSFTNPPPDFRTVWLTYIPLPADP